MMHIKKYMEQAIAKGNKEDMQELGELFFEMANFIYNCDKNFYKKIECKMYELANGKNITLELAEKWVDEMMPRAKWYKNETDNLIKQKGLQVNDIEFYVTMNMLHSDYNNVIEDDVEKYIIMAMDFLKDEDVAEHKLFNYYFKVVK